MQNVEKLREHSFVWRAHFVEYFRKWESFISIWKRDFNQWNRIIVLFIVYAYASHFHDMYSDGIIHVVLKVRRKVSLLSTISCNIHDYHIRQNKSHKLCYHDKFPSNWFGLVSTCCCICSHLFCEWKEIYVHYSRLKKIIIDRFRIRFLYIELIKPSFFV